MDKKNLEKKGNKNDDDKIFGFLGVFLGLLGFIIVLLAKKESKYAMYYGKQGLILSVVCIIVWIIMAIASAIFMFIPGLNLIVSGIWGILGLGMLVLWLIGWINALSGQMKPLPLLQQFADKIKL